MANEQNLVPFTSDQSREEAAKNGRKGGIASGVARREKATLRAVLMEELDRVDEGTGLTRRQILIKKAMANHAKGKLSFKDLKDLADLLGESEQTLNIKGEGFNVVINTAEDAEAVGALINREQ